MTYQRRMFQIDIRSITHQYFTAGTKRDCLVIRLSLFLVARMSADVPRRVHVLCRSMYRDVHNISIIVERIHFFAVNG